MNFLDKARALPPEKKKKIVWAAVIIAGFILFPFWMKNVYNRLEQFGRDRPAFIESFDFPGLQTEELKMSKEELEMLQEMIKEMEKEIEETERTEEAEKRIKELEEAMKEIEKELEEEKEKLKQQEEKTEEIIL